ncbi:MAG: DUF3570 domain-containing protein [Gammaproteobacteria bacterium]|nr:DUF3570 domain-containing protein [Gammaproteobacteria bacterium]
MKSIKDKLSIATCTLLTGGAHQAQAIDNAWDLDTSYLYYGEADDRVTVNKAIANLSGDITDNDRVTINLVLDTMSGATPTGAVESETSSVTFSSASGAGGSTATGGAPDIADFSDTRLGFSLSWEQTISRLRKLTYGGNLSVEKDYHSYGANATLNQDTEDRGTTYTAGLAVTYDEIFTKTGGTPDPLGRVEDGVTFGDGERYTYNAIVGVSKVLNKKTVAQLNYNITYSDGYHTDPYKVISEVRLVGDSETNAFAFAETDRYYESRPGSRLRHALFTSMAHQYGEKGEVVHLSYRYYFDDWDISAHTIDLTHRTPLGLGRYIEPHFRFHMQSSAEFFMHSILDDGSPLPEFASADYRLDQSTGYTIGAEYGQPWKGGNLRIRLEQMEQNFEDAEYDENSALIFQVSYQKLF